MEAELFKGTTQARGYGPQNPKLLNNGIMGSRHNIYDSVFWDVGDTFLDGVFWNREMTKDIDSFWSSEISLALLLWATFTIIGGVILFQIDTVMEWIEKAAFFLMFGVLETWIG